MKKEKYEEIISGFLDGDLSAKDFKQIYQDNFLSEPQVSNDKRLFDILDWLFACADDFNPDESTFGLHEITEHQLREAALKVLEFLKS